MLDIQAELHDAGGPYQDLYEAVADLKRRHDLHPCSVRPRDGLALRSEGEREAIQELVARFRRLPEDTRRRLPALWNSLGQLEVVIGDLDAGVRDFEEVARLVQDPISRAEAHHNVHRAALERRDWDAALTALRRAVALDADMFEPFPFARYEPRQILGAGGFGVSFLCRDRAADRMVVVKALRTDALDREVPAVLQEARTLQELDHPAVIGVHEVGLAGPDANRPYLVLEHFEGESLAAHIHAHGPLAPEEFLDVAWPIARALQALHGRLVLHRCLRPGAVLVRRLKNRDGESRLMVKLLDTGLALRRPVLHACASYPEACRRSALGRSVAGLLPFLPPEVVGRPKGQVWVGPHSDLYGFGRLCAFGLTGQADPDRADRLLLPEVWAALIDTCTAWVHSRRPPHVGAVLERLGQAPAAAERVRGIERDLHDLTVNRLTAALEADPDDLDAYTARAAAYVRQGELEKAVADLTAALDRRPEDAVLYRRRAQVHARGNDLDAAIADYTESLRLDPRSLEARGNRGLAYAQQGDAERAIADYTEGLRLAPRDEQLYYNRGNAYYVREEYDRAIADYTEALRLDPRHLWALSNRGKAYLFNREPARAAADFTRLLQLDPVNARARCDRAAAYLALDDPERAIADYSEALRLAPSAPLYQERGQAHLRAGDPAAAVADFTEALNLSPDNAAVLIARGRARLDAGAVDEAEADLNRAPEVAPRAPPPTWRGPPSTPAAALSEAIADCTHALEAARTAAAAIRAAATCTPRAATRKRRSMTLPIFFISIHGRRWPTPTAATRMPVSATWSGRWPTTTRRWRSTRPIRSPCSTVPARTPAWATRRRRWPTTPRSCGSTRRMRAPTSAAVCCWPAWARPTVPSPTSTGRSPSTRPTHARITSAATCGPTVTSSPRRWPTSPRRSASIPLTCRPGITAASPTPRQAGTPRQSPTTPRCCGSTRGTWARPSTAAPRGGGSASSTRRWPT
ncbi:MAG: tetratricopeptide repeat protein [Gemmataceae bacterium]